MAGLPRHERDGARRLYNHKAIEDNTLDHFRPWSKLFPPNWERRIYVGTTCWLACFAGIMYSTYKFGFTAVACWLAGAPTCGSISGSSCTPGSSTRRRKCPTLGTTSGRGSAGLYAPSTGPTPSSSASSTGCTTTSARRTSATTSSVTCRATTLWRPQTRQGLPQAARIVQLRPRRRRDVHVEGGVECQYVEGTEGIHFLKARDLKKD